MLEKVRYGSSGILSYGIFFTKTTRVQLSWRRMGSQQVASAQSTSALVYFFITDHIIKKVLNVEWGPKNDMIGDLMTNTTQESLFKKYRDLIMGVTSIKKNIK